MLGAVGCSNFDPVNTKLDMAAERVDEPGKPIYEGPLESMSRVGSMVSLQFADGKMFDVAEAPTGIVRDDIIRIYARKNGGYEAHLWHRGPGPLVNSENPPNVMPAERYRNLGS